MDPIELRLKNSPDFLDNRLRGLAHRPDPEVEDPVVLNPHLFGRGLGDEHAVGLVSAEKAGQGSSAPSGLLFHDAFPDQFSLGLEAALEDGLEGE
jgi:hypothetical protein